MNETPDVSVIIVTYNSAHYISFCLDSLSKSKNYDLLDILIVDNDSRDHTADLIKQRFSKVRLLVMDENIGFAAACNYGAEQAKADKLLFLNPDCVLTEDAIAHLLDGVKFANVGMAGPLLIDGSGRILPETARDIPSLKSAFFKLVGNPFGLGDNYYHKISDETFEAPILSGACMIMEKKKFYQIGQFDEAFFMYGEDIDLSFRMKQGGFHNLVIPDAQVIHFKGESTDKSERSYYKHFFKSINIFLRKHGQYYNYKILGPLSKMAIRAMMTVQIIISFLNRIRPVLIDGILILIAIYSVQFLWGYIKSGDVYYYGVHKYANNIFAYTLVWLVALYYNGLYHRDAVEVKDVFKGGLFGGLMLLIIYALLPEKLRFSRMIIVISTLAITAILMLRYYFKSKRVKRNSVIISNNSENDFIRTYSKTNQFPIKDFRSISEKTYSNTELIFDTNSLPISEIVTCMRTYVKSYVYTFWNSKRNEFFSSINPKRRGSHIDIYSHYHLSRSVYKTHKRTFDILFGLVVLLPFLINSVIRMQWKAGKIIHLLKGRITVVGYHLGSADMMGLPPLKPSLIFCYKKDDPVLRQKQAAHDYAANYSILDDVFISLSEFQLLFSSLHTS